MDKDRVEGNLEDLKGGAKRKVGEWTGDKETEAEGATEQVKGKIQNAWGKVKDAGRDILDKGKEEVERHEKDKDEPAA